MAVWRKSSHSGGDEGNCVEVAALWRKSSYSGGHEGECVEVAALWRKSSYSGGDEGECVEVTDLAGTIGVRDSKDPGAGHLALSRESFAALITRLRQD